jgi:hypothetical protein
MACMNHHCSLVSRRFAAPAAQHVLDARYRSTAPRPPGPPVIEVSEVEIRIGIASPIYARRK